MAALGRRLAARGRRPLFGAAEWRSADLAGAWAADPHDLVTAAYVLGELPGGRQAELVRGLWERAGMALVLIEPGTPQGWAAIRAAREQLRAAGAWLVAPCPHQGPCPMPADDWCHFAQRIGRSRAHRAAKGAALAYEDEKFSYVAVARGPGDPIQARVLRHPLVRPGRVELALCADSGLRRALITRGGGEAWRLARDLRWGDPLPPGALDEL
jgi:ribosomal protein RSM22 (predicted rRNA methylase)